MLSDKAEKTILDHLKHFTVGDSYVFELHSYNFWRLLMPSHKRRLTRLSFFSLQTVSIVTQFCGASSKMQAL